MALTITRLVPGRLPILTVMSGTDDHISEPGCRTSSAVLRPVSDAVEDEYGRRNKEVLRPTGAGERRLGQRQLEIGSDSGHLAQISVCEGV